MSASRGSCYFRFEEHLNVHPEVPLEITSLWHMHGIAKLEIKEKSVIKRNEKLLYIYDNYFTLLKRHVLINGKLVVLCECIEASNRLLSILFVIMQKLCNSEYRQGHD